MDQRTKSIIFGAIGLLVLAAVLGTIIYLGKFTKTQSRIESDTTNNNSLLNLPVASVSPTTAPRTGDRPATTLKAYVGQGYNVFYPAGWGLLTCNNSKNFELDPANSTDTKNFACNLAVKPVTVLVVDQLNCQGDKVKIGNYQVTKSKAVTDNGVIDYRWCFTAVGKNFDITHRVSPMTTRAASKEDFSTQIEQMIGNIASTPAGS